MLDDNNPYRAKLSRNFNQNGLSSLTLPKVISERRSSVNNTTATTVSSKLVSEYRQKVLHPEKQLTMEMILQAGRSLEDYVSASNSPVRQRFGKRVYLPDTTAHKAWIKSHLTHAVSHFDEEIPISYSMAAR